MSKNNDCNPISNTISYFKSCILKELLILNFSRGLGVKTESYLAFSIG